MLIGCRPRSCLNLVVPDMRSKVEKKQQLQKYYHDQRARGRFLQVSR